MSITSRRRSPHDYQNTECVAIITIMYFLYELTKLAMYLLGD